MKDEGTFKIHHGRVDQTVVLHVGRCNKSSNTWRKDWSSPLCVLATVISKKKIRKKKKVTWESEMNSSAQIFILGYCGQSARIEEALKKNLNFILLNAMEKIGHFTSDRSLSILTRGREIPYSVRNQMSQCLKHYVLVKSH